MAELGTPWSSGDLLSMGVSRTTSFCELDDGNVSTPDIPGCKGANTHYIRPTSETPLILRVNADWSPVIAGASTPVPVGGSFVGTDLPNAYTAGAFIHKGDYPMENIGGDGEEILQFSADITGTAKIYKYPKITNGVPTVIKHWRPYEDQDFPMTTTEQRILGDTGSGGSDLRINKKPCRWDNTGNELVGTYICSGYVRDIGMNAAAMVLSISDYTMRFSFDIIRNEPEFAHCRSGNVTDEEEFESDTIKSKAQIIQVNTPHGPGSPGLLYGEACAACQYWCFGDGTEEIIIQGIYLPGTSPYTSPPWATIIMINPFFNSDL